MPICRPKINVWFEIGQNTFSGLDARAGLGHFLITPSLGSGWPNIDISNENSKWIFFDDHYILSLACIYVRK